MRDAVYVCAWISHLCMHKRVEACVCVRCPSVVLDGVGHDGDGDEVEYNDKDEESYPLCLHNPTCTQGEGGGCVCLMGDCKILYILLLVDIYAQHIYLCFI